MEKLVFIILSCCFFACTNTTKPEPNAEQKEFFPVKSFFNDQIRLVDSFKLPTRKYLTVNNRTDSVLISPEEFHSIANEFLATDINDPAVKKLYKETSFADQSIPSITFTYTALEDSLTLRRMDVLLNPDPVMDDQVKSIYIEKIIGAGDSSILKKMYWKKDKYLQVISTKKAVGNDSGVTRIKVSWSAD